MLLGHRIILLLCSHTEAGKCKCDLVCSTWTYFNSLLLVFNTGKTIPSTTWDFWELLLCFCALVVRITSSDIWVLCTARAWKSQGGACPCRDHQAGAGGEHFRRQFKASRLYSTYRQHICTAALLPVCCGTPLQMQGLTEDTNICRAFLLLLFQSAHLSSFLIAS